MYQASEFLLTLSVILLVGLTTEVNGRRTFLPRVTMWLMFSVVIGKQVLGLIHPYLLSASKSLPT